MVDGKEKKGSIVDIDIVQGKPDMKEKPAVAAILRVMSQANQLADKQFFRLMRDSFIQQFGPEY